MLYFLGQIRKVEIGSKSDFFLICGIFFGAKFKVREILEHYSKLFVIFFGAKFSG